MIGRLKTEADLRRFIESELRRPGAVPPAPVDERVGIEPFAFPEGSTATALIEVEHELGLIPTWVGLTVIRPAGESTFASRLVEVTSSHIKFQVNCSTSTSASGSVMWRARGGIA